MANEPQIVIAGRVGGDVEINFTPQGKPVAKFSLACTPSVKTDSGWEDKDTIWVNVSCWRNAENVAETLSKGDLVVVTGRFSIRNYVNKAQENKTEMRVDADHVGSMAKTSKKETVTEQPSW